MEDGGIGGLLFYIIAAVIGIIASIAGKKKKREDASNYPDFETSEEESVQTEPANDAFGDMKRRVEAAIREMTGEEEISYDFEKEGEYEQPMTAEIRSEGVSSLNEVVPVGTSLENLKLSSATFDIKSEETFKSIDESSIAFEEAESFDFKTAIIFSDILKPKFSSY